MAQISLFDDPAKTKVMASKITRGMEMQKMLQEVKQQVLLAEDSIRLGGNPELVVPRVLREIRWSHLGTMNLPRPTTGDLFQAINTALRFIVTSQMPDYSFQNEKGDTIRSKPKLEKLSVGEANQALHVLMKCDSLFDALIQVTDHYRTNPSKPFANIDDLEILRNEIENGV